MRLVSAWIVVAFVGTACSNDKVHLHPDGVFDSSTWQPKPGETKNWDIQVHAPFDFSAERAMFIIDLWASVPAATTIDYGDGDPVSVPAGSQRQTIGILQAKQTVIVCRVGLGGLKLDDPDARKFPSAAIGNVPTEADPNERFLDFAQRASWEDIAFARVDLAKQIGCDAIEPYLSDHGNLDTGFTPDFEQQQSWYAKVALEVHERELSAGMRNGLNVAQVEVQVANYDWLLVERCGEAVDCALTRSFRDAHKAVFAIDFPTNFEGTAQDPAQMCSQQISGNIEDGIVKDVALSNAFRLQCE